MVGFTEPHLPCDQGRCFHAYRQYHRLVFMLILGGSPAVALYRHHMHILDVVVQQRKACTGKPINQHHAMAVISGG